MIDEVYPQQKQLELEMLMELYTNQMIALEQARGQKQQKTPMIQVLDEPDEPFAVSKKPAGIFALLGFVLGVVLMSIWIVRKLLLEDGRQLVASMIEQSKEDETPTATDP